MGVRIDNRVLVRLNFTIFAVTPNEIVRWLDIRASFRARLLLGHV